jgi:hypothetical protein
VFWSDSLPFVETRSLPLRVVSFAPLLAETVVRLNGEQAPDELVVHANAP